jgi:surface protein
MFTNCISLKSIDLSSFNTSTVTIMLGVFQNCRDLSYLDISNFDTSNVMSMRDVFTNCEKLSYLKLIEDIDKELEEYYDKLDQMDIETKYSTIRLRFYQNNDVGFMQVFGNTVLGSLSFVGISLLIVLPFLLCGLIVYIVLRKKNKKEIKE